MTKWIFISFWFWIAQKIDYEHLFRDSIGRNFRSSKKKKEDNLISYIWWTNSGHGDSSWKAFPLQRPWRRSSFCSKCLPCLCTWEIYLSTLHSRFLHFKVMVPLVLSDLTDKFWIWKTLCRWFHLICMTCFCYLITNVDCYSACLWPLMLVQTMRSCWTVSSTSGSGKRGLLVRFVAFD